MQYLYRYIRAGILLVTGYLLTNCQSPTDATPIAHQPVLFPDYTEVTFPSNIAPPNFIIQETAEKYDVEIGTSQQVFFKKKSRNPQVIISPAQWRKMLEEAENDRFYIRISAFKEGVWRQYEDIINYIADSPIDPYLAYRLLYPGYEVWNEMGIYQRNLTNYEEVCLLDNNRFGKGCVNCHTFNKNSPQTMMIHIRGESGGTVIHRNDKTKKVNTQTTQMENAGTYAAWHPGGRYIACSVNEVRQLFHAAGAKAAEVFDLKSDLIVLDTETNTLLTDSLIYGDEWLETFPHWSPDGKVLYYCRTDAVEEKEIQEIRYDLYKIGFDPATGEFGRPECVYEASARQQSVSFPRVSPDGQYLMFTCSDYGTFSIWHPESELFLLNLTTGDVRNMQEVNSPDVESFHSWSSSGEWFVFSSKRIDGLWAAPFIAYFDPVSGKASKPFVLPQKDPAFYTRFSRTFNLPELITDPVDYTGKIYEQIKESAQQAHF